MASLPGAQTSEREAVLTESLSTPSGDGWGELATRAQREELARTLRDEGLLMREIAQRMGVATSTVDGYLNDPGGGRLRARKDSYRGACERCGGPTHGSNGTHRAPRVCLECISWTDEAIIAALRAWAQKYGASPKEVAWRRAGEGHPSSTCVSQHFGTWNRALTAAGLPLNHDRSPETLEWIIEQFKAGRSTDAIAADLGVTHWAITRRLSYRRISIRALRAAP
jgi:Homing endonuclease associated repeat